MTAGLIKRVRVAATIAAGLAIVGSLTLQVADASPTARTEVRHVSMEVPSEVSTKGDVQILDSVFDVHPGDVLELTLGTNAPVGLLGITVHLCRTGFGSWTASQYGYAGADGTRCVYEPGIVGSTGLEPDDATYALGPDTYNGTPQIAPPYDFVIGAGHVEWKNTSNVSSSMDCDATHPCDVVVKLDTTAGSAIGIFTLDFASDVIVTTTTTSSTTTTSTTSTTAAPTTTTPATTLPPPTTVVAATVAAAARPAKTASLALTGDSRIRDLLSIAMLLLGVGLFALAHSLRREEKP